MKALTTIGVAVTLAAAPGGPGEAASYDAVLFQESFMMPMRDGVKLATDIYRPATGGRLVEERLPILLHRTPYDKSARAEQARHFARHGYVVAVQDTRGRHQSEGEFSKYHKYDALDGYDAVQGLAALPYTDGQVGMWGTSYAAHTQADAAKLNPPALKTLVLNQGGQSNAWDHVVRYNGAFLVGRELTWAWRQLARDTDNPVVAKLLAQEKVTDWYDQLPFRKGLNPLSIVPNFEDYILNEWTNADYDDYWKGLGLNWVEYYDQTSDIPMLHIGGWYDVFTKTTVTNFRELSRRKKSPQRMLIGPWTHGGNARTYAGDVDFGPQAAITDFDGDFHLRWFDHVLKGKPTGVEQEAPVRLFVMGGGDGRQNKQGRLNHGGYWRSETAWPIPGTRFTPYYFRADGALSTTPPEADEPVSTTYTFDPRDPVPTIGGGVSRRLRDGAFDQHEDPRFHGSKMPYLPLKARADVVVFQTEPLEQDVEVVGPIAVKLFASSTAVDTDFTVKLVDVHPATIDYPRGFDMNLTDAIQRGRYRTRPDRPALMTPGKIYPLTIETFPTANIFKAGHRIRVDISSSNFPRFDVNPNTGEPLGKNRRLSTADNTVHHSMTHPSSIVLPIVPTARR